MVIYKCTRCLKEFNKKSNYNFHVNRKYKCEQKNEENEENESVSDFRDDKIKLKYECEGCNEKFSTRSNLFRHQRRKKCNIIIDLQNKNKELLNEINKEKDVLKSEIVREVLGEINKKIGNNESIMEIVISPKISETIGEILNQNYWYPIKNFSKYEINSSGQIRNVKSKRELKGCCLSGYKTIGLSNDSKVISCRVHRLVADTFIPNPENKPSVNHIDGNKFNNHVSNLEWVTPSENSLHWAHVLRANNK